MAAIPIQPRVVKFGVFEVDLQAGEVRKAGMRQKLAGQPFQVLQALLEHPQEIVTRKDLRERIWPGNAFIDYELALKKAVNRLRELLGDSAESPHFIETVPRRGYRFIGTITPPLSVPADSGEHTVGAVEMTGPPIDELRSKTWKPSKLLGSLALACVAAVVLWSNVDKLRSRIFARPRSLEIHSVAVLPLENLSKDPEQEYFSDGMTDELITDLAKVGQLQVISHTSVERYKGTKLPLREIARELGVDAVVEGRVMRSGDRVRITAQLIDARTDRHLWADTYERDVRDILGLQDEVAHRIATQVGINLTAGGQTEMASTRVVDSAAQEAYLKGRYRWNQRTEAGLRAGIKYFQKAIDLDPNYPQAYAGLADCYIMMANWGFMLPAEAYPNAEVAARKALALDDHLAEAYTSLAYATLLYDWEWSGAEQKFRRAIELNPNYATAHHFYSIYLMAAGRHTEARAEIRRAQALDPFSLIINSVVGWIYYEGRQYDQAIQQCEKTVEMDPNYVPALLDLGNIYLRTGDYKKAIAQFERARAVAGDKSIVLSYLAQVRALSGDRAAAQKILYQLEKPAPPMFVSTWDLALIHLALGDKEKALSFLEKAVDQHVGWVVRLGVDPALDSLRVEPRFKVLQQRVRIPLAR
jgi:TolB-like protein/DNA-binding winged helix-turn-helix (wHTH) protein/Tfp pilus assembly protein PilF